MMMMATATGTTAKVLIDTTTVAASEVNHHDDHNDDGGNLYHVQVIETEASIRCGLKPYTVYKLVLQPYEIQLVQQDLDNDDDDDDDDADDDRLLYAWPYRFVRRYGYTANSLSFEAGSKCHTGEGLFIFRNKKAKVLYQKIAANIAAIKRMRQQQQQQQHQQSSLITETGSGQPTASTAAVESFDDSSLVPHLVVNGCPYAQIIRRK